MVNSIKLIWVLDLELFSPYLQSTFGTLVLQIVSKMKGGVEGLMFSIS